jgi:CheY-like chemotaxis protein
LGLPDIGGWEVLKAFKESYKQAGRTLPPIIVITAYGDPANRLVGKFQDVDAYLIKPFTPDQVEKLVMDVLAGLKPANQG